MSDITLWIKGVKDEGTKFREREGFNRTQSPMIEVRDVWKSFGGREVLKGINLTIQPGEIAVIMGSSGCGKTTLLKTIIGALRPDRGEILIDGENVVGLPEEDMNRVRRKFGVLFQSSALFNSLSVGENVALPIQQHTELPQSTIDIMVKMKLENVGLRDAERLYPSQLSGGMKKRVGLARAIALDPQIVFYDEPSAGLDPIVTGVIDKLIVDLTQKLAITSVVITHEMRSAFRIADTMIMLHEGEVVLQGEPASFRQSDNPLVIQFVNGNAEGPMAQDSRRTSFVEDILRW